MAATKTSPWVWAWYAGAVAFVVGVNWLADASAPRKGGYTIPVSRRDCRLYENVQLCVYNRGGDGKFSYAIGNEPEGLHPWFTLEGAARLHGEMAIDEGQRGEYV